MYPFQLPHTISNPFGEELTFHSVEIENGSLKMNVINKLQPGSGPPFRVHFKQDACLTVVKGRLGYQIRGLQEKYIGEGESVKFQRGQFHRFWNAGEDILECTGWLQPANSIDFFLTGIYQSMTKSGKATGDRFDNAFLLTRYKSEYEMENTPPFVQKVVLPMTVVVGRLLGKYSHFKYAPKPLK